MAFSWKVDYDVDGAEGVEGCLMKKNGWSIMPRSNTWPPAIFTLLLLTIFNKQCSLLNEILLK